MKNKKWKWSNPIIISDRKILKKIEGSKKRKKCKLTKKLLIEQIEQIEVMQFKIDTLQGIIDERHFL